MQKVLQTLFSFALIASLAFLTGCTLLEAPSGKWGFIDKQGNIAISPQFDEVAEDNDLGFNYLGQPFRNFSEGLCAVKINNNWGYIDRQGKFVVKPQFDAAYPFSEGLACVGLGTKYGYIDTSGQTAIPLKFDWLAKQYLHKMCFSEGLACAQIGNKTGYINRTGQIIIQPKFVDAGPFSEGIARVSFPDDPENCYIDKSGKVLFRSLGGEYLCTEGTILVADTNRHFIFVDKTGKNIFNKSFSEYAHPFSEGLAGVSLDSSKKDNLWGYTCGYINKAGNIVIPARFRIPGNGHPSFVEGRSVASITNISIFGTIEFRYGLIDKSGNWILQPHYESISCFRDGLAVLRKGLCGFVDHNGKMVIEAKYRRANSFSDGLAAVWITN